MRRAHPGRDDGRYGWTSHLLLSRGHVYVVPLHDDSSARMQIVSYYCPEVRAGCLTIRWTPCVEPGHFDR